MCVYVCMSVCACTRAPMSTAWYVGESVLGESVRVRVCVYVCVCVYARSYVCCCCVLVRARTHTYAHIHTLTHTQMQYVPLHVPLYVSLYVWCCLVLANDARAAPYANLFAPPRWRCVGFSVWRCVGVCVWLYVHLLSV